jgi:hypothetical protein
MKHKIVSELTVSNFFEEKMLLVPYQQATSTARVLSNRQHRMQQLDNNFITFLNPLSRFQGMDIQLREICYDN